MIWFFVSTLFGALERLARPAPALVRARRTQFPPRRALRRRTFDA